MKLNLPERISTFFFKPASARPIAVLRILLSITLLVQAFLLSSAIFELYGQTGVLQESVNNYLLDPRVPRMTWLFESLKPWGLSERACILVVGIAYVASLVCLLVGFITRAAAFFAWGFHWTLMNSGYCTNYGADTFSHIFLFYLIFMPAGSAYSLDRFLWRGRQEVSDVARLSLRVLQLHLCMVYFASGIEKAFGHQWWSGEVIWRSLMLPVYSQYDFSWLAGFPLIAKLASRGTLLVELGYPFLIWSRRTRPLWISLTIGLHVGIALFLGLGIFGMVMAILTPAVFGVSATPKNAPMSANAVDHFDFLNNTTSATFPRESL